jgi:hypothetical protein
MTLSHCLLITLSTQSPARAAGFSSCSYPLLILDDFGMERGTEYGLVDFDIGFIGSEHFASGFQYSFVIVVIYKRLNTHGS